MCVGFDAHHIEHALSVADAGAAANTEAAALTDRVVDDALMAAQHRAGEIDNIAGLARFRAQALDNTGVIAVRHEADVLAVGLVGGDQFIAARQIAHLILRQIAQRKAQKIHLFAGRGEQEIALVAGRIGGAMQLRTRAAIDAANVVPGRQHIGVDLARGRHQIAELHSLVTRHARDRRFPANIGIGEAVDDVGAEPGLIVEHVMGNVQPVGDPAGIVDILAGTAGLGFTDRRAVIVELQRDTDDIVALVIQQRSRHRTIDAARHGDDDTGGLRLLGYAKAVQGLRHGRQYRRTTAQSK